jgi:Na+/proline symporter
METVALSIMVCNDLLLPLILKHRTAGAEGSGDMSRLLLNIRRASILAIILLAYVLYDSINRHWPRSTAFLRGHCPIRRPSSWASVWRRATARGAGGHTAGFAVWAYRFCCRS